MSMFEDTHYRWRETYFVLFQAADRPSLKQVEQAIGKLDAHYELSHSVGDDDGQFESVTLISPDDYAALDICYTEGEDVRDQVHDLLGELKPADLGPKGLAGLARLPKCDARFDILHFEQIGDEDDEEEVMLDPGSLLLVLGQLAKIANGIAIDPQSGTILEEDC